MKIGINGFGRIGRLFFRQCFGSNLLDVIQINDLHSDAKIASHLLEFDTVHGRWKNAISSKEQTMIVGESNINVTNNEMIAATDWSACDIVVDASGAFRTKAALQAYFEQGVKQVIVAAPVPEALNIVIGCNEQLYEPEQHPIITAASCTTNCIAPAIKVIQENLGIKHATITTLHNVTNTQVIVDAPHRDLRRARSAINSLIPTSTGSAKAISMIFPELTNKINGLAVRVPLLNASLTDCVFELNKSTSATAVNQLLEQASKHELRGILGYEEKPLVSADYTNDTRSGIIDAPSTMVIDNNLLKLMIWYDNELGYATRLTELTQLVVQKLTT